MVKHIAIILILIIISIIVFYFPGKISPEQQIENQITKFLSKASKSPGDKLSTGLLKSKSLESLFAPHCRFSVGVSSFSGNYTPLQVSNNSMRCRTIFKHVRFRAHDIKINLVSLKTATVNFTASINGLTKRGEAVDDYKELTCKLRLTEGNWLVYAISIREIIKK